MLSVLLAISVVAAIIEALYKRYKREKAFRDFESQFEDDGPERKLDDFDRLVLEAQNACNKKSPTYDAALHKEVAAMMTALCHLTDWAKKHNVTNQRLSKIHRYYIPTAYKTLKNYNDIRNAHGVNADVLVKDSTRKGIQTLTCVFEKMLTKLMAPSVSELNNGVRALEVISATDGLNDNCRVAVENEGGLLHLSTISTAPILDSAVLLEMEGV